MLWSKCSRLLSVLIPGVVALSTTSCLFSKKGSGPIAEPVRVKRDEFVLRKPLELKCDAAKEFITAMQYLRNESELALASAEATKIATEVSAGCNGAAKRFIVNTDMLRQSGMDARSALKLGKQLAVTDEVAATAFTKIFLLSYERLHLDLDFAHAVRLAQKLSLDFSGDPAVAANDFDEVVSFCQSRRGLDLSKPQCGELAARIAILSADLKDGLADMFVESFQFLTEKGGPGLTAKDALRIAEALAAAGPRALDNFKDVYGYATVEKGLNLARGEAVSLAASVAAHSRNQPVISPDSQVGLK